MNQPSNNQMKRITFHCNTITPLFMAGADGHNTELRVPSIKGALRFWWRAMNGNLPLVDLKKREKEIFGGVSGDKGKRSAVQIRLNIRSTENKSIKELIDVRPPSGLSYLMYSLKLNKRYDYKDLSFSITFSGRKEQPLIEAAKAFWLLANFGGLGTRSRRGCGNFVIKSVHLHKLTLEFDLANPETEIESYLRKGVEITVRKNSSSKPKGKSSYSTLSNANIYLLRGAFKSPLEAMESIGRDFMIFRRVKRPDYDEVKEFIRRGRDPAEVRRASFGLPLTFRFRTLNGASAQTLVKSSRRREDPDIERSASSLWISIIPEGKNFRVLLTNFNTRLIPTGRVLNLRSGRNVSPQFPVSAINIKQDFINTLSSIQIL